MVKKNIPIRSVSAFSCSSSQFKSSDIFPGVDLLKGHDIPNKLLEVLWSSVGPEFKTHLITSSIDNPHDSSIVFPRDFARKPVMLSLLNFSISEVCATGKSF